MGTEPRLVTEGLPALPALRVPDTPVVPVLVLSSMEVATVPLANGLPGVTGMVAVAVV